MSQRYRGKLPPPNRVPWALGEVLKITQFGVGSWCPTPDGSGPPEAVVIHFRAADLEFGLQLKSAERVDELIAMLERHRNDVWPHG